MDNKNLFKEAIADAKAVREAALANAKAALEEALTPKLQSMLAAKLNEMDYEEEGIEEAKSEDEMEEGFTTSHGDDSEENLDFNLEEDFDLSEILAELDEEEKEIKEAKEEDEEESEEEEEEGEEEGEEEEQNVADMTIEDLKALIQDIVAQEAGSEGEEEDGEGMSMGMGGEEESGEESDEIDLEELLAELDALGENEEEETMDEAKKSKKEDEKKKKEDKSEMKEAIDTINTLRSELNEVNLLNAKLLYVNKIFKAKNLTESQKLQVIASFDKATTAKEAKIVYESLQSTLTAAPAKKAIKESMGFASKATGNAPRKSIVETDEAITRMQKLANIIK